MLCSRFAVSQLSCKLSCRTPRLQGKREGLEIHQAVSSVLFLPALLSVKRLRNSCLNTSDMALRGRDDCKRDDANLVADVEGQM